MANPTTNFGWVMPTPTDLVTDLPADFAVFGQGVDTSFQYLKGGTTGQILSKTSGTDLAFTWITNDIGDITAVTATSPLTGGGTSGAITVGIQDASTSQKGSVQLSDSTSTTSSVLAATPTAVKSAYDLASSAYASGFTNNFFAGKNKIINGDFGIWQRGTSITATSGAYTYGPDRFAVYGYGVGTGTVTQQTFTPGTAPVAGYEGQFFARFKSTNTNLRVQQPIEDVRTFAGQTVAVSFWMKSPTGTTADVFYSQNFGSGGSASVDIGGSTITISSAWARYTATVAIPSVAGKTIGTGSYLALRFGAAINLDIDIWGVQMEVGSTASPFQTATGTKQGELAACQRYYYRQAPASGGILGTLGQASGTGRVDINVPFSVTMRDKPASIDTATGANYTLYNGSAAGISSITTITLDGTSSTANNAYVSFSKSAAFTNAAVYWASTNAASTYLGFSAEL